MPDLLRGILEETLSQEASTASLNRFLPRIRDIVINLLHGLKRKQQKLRSSKSGSGNNPAIAGITNGGDTSLMQMLEDGTSSQRASSRGSERRHGSGGSTFIGDEPGVPPRVSSIQNGSAPPVRQNSGNTLTDAINRNHNRESDSRSIAVSNLGSSISDMSLQSSSSLPHVEEETIERVSPQGNNAFHAPPPPPPPPKQHDALAALQRHGDLERRASRRYSQYQISKHLGASPSGVPMLPPAQNSPIPNRGRDVRESMNAVRVRGSGLNSRQRSNNRTGESSPMRNTTFAQRISEEAGAPIINLPSEMAANENAFNKTPEDKLRQSYLELDSDGKPMLGATMTGPPTSNVDGIPMYDITEDEDVEPRDQHPIETINQQNDPAVIPEAQQPTASTPPQAHQFTPEQSPQPGKELTLFLQYRSKIKKFVLPDGENEVSVARLQLAFIEKFAWNTHSNGNDLPEIYIQDPISGVRHELEDLSDVKDRSVLVLNIEVLDEVKRHIDEGLGGLRRMVEGVRTVVDGNQAVIQRFSDQQQDSTKEVARLVAARPAQAPRMGSSTKMNINGIRSSTPYSDNSDQISEVQSLRRDLAVVRQTYSTFMSDINSSIAEIRSKASAVKSVAVDAVVPSMENSTGRSYVNTGKKTLAEDSEKIVNRVDDLQDIVEDLRKDVVTRGVRPLPRQLETVSKDISFATAELKKMQEYLKREKPIWTKIWEKELELVCTDRDLLTMQEELAADLEDDLEKATQTFALVEEATKQQNLQSSQGSNPTLRSTSRGLTSISIDQDVDPMKAKDGVLGAVRALRPNHETRLEAIERAEKARQKELENRREGEFKKELGNFVEEGKLKRSGGFEEAERLRKAKDEKNRRAAWDTQQERASSKGKEAEKMSSGSEGPTTYDEEARSPEAEFTEAQEQVGSEVEANSPGEAADDELFCFT